MGTYNSTTAKLACPRCGRIAEFDVSLYFGDTRNCSYVAIGDIYPFIEGSEPENGGPVPEGQGYAECDICRLDFFCIAQIENGNLSNIVPDLLTTPYVPDERLEGTESCSKCGSYKTVVQKFKGKYNMAVSECITCGSIWRYNA